MLSPRKKRNGHCREQSTANADRPTIALNAMLQVVCFPFGLPGFLTWPSYLIGSFRDSVPEWSSQTRIEIPRYPASSA